MIVKIDTKEKFTVITPLSKDLSANMTGELSEKLNQYLLKSTPHVVLNMEEVESIAVETGALLADIQQTFYDKKASFVICALQADVEVTLDNLKLLEFMNVTPTESEAWDIVQMEEIERELLNDFDEEN